MAEEVRCTVCGQTPCPYKSPATPAPEMVEWLDEMIASIGTPNSDWCEAQLTAFQEARRQALSLSPASIRQEGMERWMLADTAPAEELVWCFEPHSEGGFMFAGFKRPDGSWGNNLDSTVQKPTHWRSLPTAPDLRAKIGSVGK